MADVVGGLGALLLPGPLLALLAAAALLAFGACCYGWGRRSAFREVDDGREAVLRATEDAARPSVVLLLPSQRDGER
ncbi:hypothetical protein GCM10010172_04540 [Paractinoplanes ferrugineus]|uniref:Uncharacterized protein n=1 Tax=Paractinoplanes ferrugineus TaxID=113564 RepID=A0A919JCK4_9ACTN|nr:hypothetical protein [Actinoplanes ferrugineus]GIE16839.1 hypothetical protein Afe05nite_86790 [Actinoplanes ferrugineus]